jgi:hypothetical protein
MGELTIELLEARMTALWRAMDDARRRERWHLYWALRRSWLATGRTYSILQEDRQERNEAQLSLLTPTEGQPHDTPPAAA